MGDQDAKTGKRRSRRDSGSFFRAVAEAAFDVDDEIGILVAAACILILVISYTSSTLCGLAVWGWRAGRVWLLRARRGKALVRW